MARMLDVYLHRELAGHLVQDDDGQMSFDYAASWLERDGAIPLSHSLPLRKERFTRKECAGFFGGILPEAQPREMVAKNLHISASNDFAMLERIGGECAGAVIFMPAGKELPEREDRYRDLSTNELAEMLRSLPKRPLLAGEQEVRLSLAGAQDKVAVKVAGDQIPIPLGEALSTHILKPANQHYAGLVFNELFCLELARAVGLPAARAEARNVDGIDFLLIERYDRILVKGDGAAQYERLHQEDFCQALGVISQRKYQNEGGPSLKQCFDLLREASTAPVIDLHHLLDAVAFNYLISNYDVHAKNFSIVYSTERGYSARFSPLYDLICTEYYPDLSKKMAMKIGGEYWSEKVFPQNFERLAEEAALAKPLVKRRIPELAAAVIAALGQIDVSHPPALDIAKIIEGRSRQAILRFKS